MIRQSRPMAGSRFGLETLESRELMTSNIDSTFDELDMHPQAESDALTAPQLFDHGAQSSISHAETVFGDLPQSPTHRISSVARYAYLHRSPDLEGSDANPDFPQYADVNEQLRIRPIRGATAVLRDDCGTYIEDTSRHRREVATTMAHRSEQVCPSPTRTPPQYFPRF